MKSPPDQNMNPPQPTGENDFIHEIADLIASDPYRMGKAINITRSIPHQPDSDVFQDCLSAVLEAWQHLAHEEAKILFNQYGKDAIEVLDND